MLNTIVRKLVGSKNEREVKRMRKATEAINALEPTFEALDDAALTAKTSEFRTRLESGESIDKILPEAFAVVREASKRVMGMRHFDVQMVGGMTLHEGRIAEMKTGEGKTLVGTLSVYLNALPGKGVHVVTVNDYLASRDAEWMRPLYEFLDLSVGTIYSGQASAQKREAYACDITYGTNNEFGFDYLRDNMAFSLDDKVQRALHYAIIDEVDSILIDEARTPLIISGPVEENVELYRRINQLSLGLDECSDEEDPASGDFILDEKQKQVELTETGHQKLEGILRETELLGADDSLYSAQNLGLLQHVHSALRARHLYHRDVDYIVNNDEVVIVDEHTGRSMPGRRWSEGLHQAVEAKEGVTIQKESQTLASTTFQNYFRLYDKLSGMTGTADTEAFEFRQIYGLDVMVIPTNRPLVRVDHNDLVYMSGEEKFEAIIDDVKTQREAGRPILVGTASIDTSEYLAQLMQQYQIPHNVLNAKQHQSEAEIIAQAGQPGAVTIATNMAGRGTDIVLGGNWEAEAAALDNPSEDQLAALKAAWQERHDAVLAAGGLHVIGSERHESRRIDNQLRGRSGRQGDPGSTRFFLSLEDNLMRLFGSDRVQRLMNALGLERGEAIEHKMVSNAVERAQKKVEGRNFDIRKQLLEYDDVSNDQRRVVYQQRDEVLRTDDLSSNIAEIREQVLSEAITSYVPPQSLAEQWDLPGLQDYLKQEFNLDVPLVQWAEEDEHFHEDLLRERLHDQHRGLFVSKAEAVGPELMRRFEKQVMLQVLDTRWKEHLQHMDHLRRGIHLRGYAQKNPKQEYKREAFELFQTLLANIKHDVIRILSHVQVRRQEEVDELERERRATLERERAVSQPVHEDAVASAEAVAAEGEERTGDEDDGQPVRREGPKVGRNDSCPCGSGKKYKHCHGKLS
ncbi:preprotein translocase subunit SecA [Chromohalobacter canadensis]|uniref:Protein translocase subunit SecA n=2 Tax=Chromohalobacter canadensis TaxID=141389 RepID=A0ABZ0YBJ9_9GAMM|nr:preprotein translocase subunit SecA [Chromohalobacter canadensis]MCK0769131.1 preprotein translocase subunit SecA [Chromohalobacter canadensis]MCT8469547.1 preprotein translocase subunit SecA [Chromohalobacter canadensis]MCT8472171.1 preprotein translocase subunit SecA [Chromohalobacter canadensis]MCT8499717.1 preprotein translocase subunit SecA [Chromohalobacter canadensis]WQH09420.1 preprotein translocase subunit SecA [Chromohalobacter canadensis]